MLIFFFFFNDTATTEIYTLSLHDALPIFYSSGRARILSRWLRFGPRLAWRASCGSDVTTQSSRTLSSGICKRVRSEEHTSELQSLAYLVCRLLLEKKKNMMIHCAA